MTRIAVGRADIAAVEVLNEFSAPVSEGQVRLVWGILGS